MAGRSLERRRSQPARRVTVLHPLERLDHDRPRLRVEVEQAIARRIDVGLERGQHERRVARGDDLQLERRIDGGGQLEQRGPDATLPAWVQMQLELVDQHTHLAARLDLEDRGSARVLHPRPRQQVREHRDAAHAGRREHDGDVVSAPWARQRRDVARVVERSRRPSALRGRSGHGPLAACPSSRSKVCAFTCTSGCRTAGRERAWCACRAPAWPARSGASSPSS